MRQVVVALLMLSVAFAGCSDDPAEESPNDCVVQEDCAAETPDQATSDASSTTATQTSASTSTGGPTGGTTGNETAPNSAPVAGLVVLVLRAAGDHSEFNVTAWDADGDAVAWGLDADGDGVVDTNGTANATAVIYFESAGTYTAELTVSDGMNATSTSLEFTIVAAEDPVPEKEDRGWYIYDPTTGLCAVKSYTAYGGLVYNSPLSGGDWYIVETNGMAGLQIENNHPLAPVGNTPVGSFALATPDCQDGDQVAL